MPLRLADFYNTTREARKAIVVDLGFLGDTVHLVPALRALQAAYPRTAWHMLTTPVGREVLGLLENGPRIWAVDLAPETRSLRAQLAVLRAIRRERVELAVNFSGADRTIFMTALTGARWRVGYAAARRHFWNRWLIPNWVAPGRRDVPVFEQRRAMLATCGIPPGPVTFGLRAPADARAWAEAAIPHGAIHLSICASTHLREWPVEQWRGLIAELARRWPGRALVATASRKPRELERLRQVAAGLPPERLLTCEGLPLPRLAALLERCALHVGPDSGVLHLAAALDRPTVGLFREYPGADEWRPRGPQHHQVTVPCPCVGQRPASCESQPVAACLAALTPATVLASIARALE